MIIFVFSLITGCTTSKITEKKDMTTDTSSNEDTTKTDQEPTLIKTENVEDLTQDLEDEGLNEVENIDLSDW